MGQFNQQSVADNGGVAWAKQVAQSMDPGAIDGQIQSYRSAVASLAHIQTTLQKVKNNLASTWEGDAAEQAQQALQQSISHAQKTQETITELIIPPLNDAKTAQIDFRTAVAAIPDEKPVPSTNFVESGWDAVTGQATPTQQVQAHNTQARYKTAQALNTLSDTYETSTNQLAAAGGQQSKFTKPPNTSAFDLGPVSSSSGNGAASGYSQNVRGSGATTTAGYLSTPHRNVSAGSNPRTAGSPTAKPMTSAGVITDPVTTLSGTTATAPTIGPVGSTDSTSTGTGNSWYSTGGVVTDIPTGGGGTGFGGKGPGEENLGKGNGAGSGGFGETSDGELTGGTGTGPRGATSSNNGSSFGDGEGERVGGARGASEGSESSETGMSNATGVGGAGAGEENLGSSRYSRGRYFDEVEQDEARPLASSVRSVYEEATDMQGNKLNLLAPGGRGAARDDEQDERGKRPSYVKEDESWNNAQRIVPPVIQ